MDKNHIAYCMKLGNPYIKQEQYQEKIKEEETEFSWIPETEMKSKMWDKKQQKVHKLDTMKNYNRIKDKDRAIKWETLLFFYRLL